MLVKTVQGGGTLPTTANAYAGSYPHIGHGSVTGGYGQMSSSSTDQLYAETLVATGQIVGALASHVEVGGGRCQTSIKVCRKNWQGRILCIKRCRTRLQAVCWTRCCPGTDVNQGDNSSCPGTLRRAQL